MRHWEGPPTDGGALDCPPGGACVNLHADKTSALVDEEIVLNLTIVNDITKGQAHRPTYPRSALWVDVERRYTQSGVTRVDNLRDASS